MPKQTDGEAKKPENRRPAVITDCPRLPSEVSIVPTGSSLAPGGELGLEDVDFGPYPVDRLQELAFSVACPESRIDGAPLSLWIEPVDPHDSGTPAWRLLSDVPRKFGIGDDETERQHICSLVADGGRLWMKWQAGVTASYPGVRLLQNSVLIATCKRSTDEQEIRLAKPILCPLIRHGPLDDRQSDLEFDFGGRLQDVPSDAVRWAIDVTHPALDGPRLFRQPSETMEVALPHRESVLVPSERVNDQEEAVEASDKIEIIVKVQFGVQQGVVSGTSSVRPQEPVWVANLFTFDRLRKFYAGEDHDLLDVYAKILRHQYRGSIGLNNTVFLEFQNNDRYPGKKRFSGLLEFEQCWEGAKHDLDEAEKMPYSTPDQREHKSKKDQQARQALNELETVRNAWAGWRINCIEGKIKTFQKALAESLRAAKDELQAPVEIRVTVTVEARDPAKKDRVYTVEIVKPENDVTRAASK